MIIPPEKFEVNNGRSISVPQSWHIFRMTNSNAFCPLDTFCEKDTGITVFILVCGFQKCREDEVPPALVFLPTCYKIRLLKLHLSDSVLAQCCPLCVQSISYQRPAEDSSQAPQKSWTVGHEWYSFIRAPV